MQADRFRYSLLLHLIFLSLVGLVESQEINLPTEKSVHIRKDWNAFREQTLRFPSISAYSSTIEKQSRGTILNPELLDYKTMLDGYYATFSTGGVGTVTTPDVFKWMKPIGNPGPSAQPTPKDKTSKPTPTENSPPSSEIDPNRAVPWIKDVIIRFFKKECKPASKIPDPEISWVVQFNYQVYMGGVCQAVVKGEDDKENITIMLVLARLLSDKGYQVTFTITGEYGPIPVGGLPPGSNKLEALEVNHLSDLQHFYSRLADFLRTELDPPEPQVKSKNAPTSAQ